jgi:hypothetical protein
MAGTTENTNAKATNTTTLFLNFIPISSFLFRHPMVGYHYTPIILPNLERINIFLIRMLILLITKESFKER